MNVVYVISLSVLFGFNCCWGVFVKNNLTNLQTLEENPAYWAEEGVWSPILEEWVLGTKREKRVMRIDDGEVTIVKKNGEDKDERESKIHNTKIVNNSHGNSKPPRQISENDLYLLNAIEKLVYKVDTMEKRLRKLEEMLYFVMAGNRIDQEPCPDSFTRIGMNCYFFANQAGREMDWKAANKQCKKLNSVLAEFETIEENQDVITYIQSNEYLRGKDFWTGGLNPGLLWIWRNSARPVFNNQGSQSGGVSGDGRCLRIAYNPKLRSYAYKGSDCSVRHNYVCEIPENSSVNEIQRIARKYNIST